MLKEAVFTMKLEPNLRDAFMSEAQASHHPASQIMRECVQRQHQAREHDDFLTHKVQTARTSMQAGVGISNEEVEAKFATRRAKVAGRV
jgi:predicted transcriptional regulator